MSESDSFIEEVSEAVRRDRLFRLFRRYGWIPVALVLLVVAGAAYNEWSKAQAVAVAEARGSAILSALAAQTPEARLAALQQLEADDPTRAVTGMLTAAEALAAEDPAAASAALAQIEADADLDTIYRQMATLKRVTLFAADSPPAERIAALTPLTTPGAPFRLLAEEQIALAEIQNGEVEAALARLRALSEDTEASGALRQRASQLIMALGGTSDAA